MKAMGGGGGSFSKSSAKHVAQATVKVKKEKKVSHSELAARWAANGGKFVEPEKKAWTKADIAQAQAEKERAEAAAKAGPTATAAGPEEAPEAPAAAVGARPHERARERMAELAAGLQALSVASDGDSDGRGDDEAPAVDLAALAECRRAQLEELTCLEAMFIDEYRLVSEAAGVEELRARLEALDESGTDDELARAVAAHPPLEFALQLTAEGSGAAVGEEEEEDGDDAAEAARRPRGRLVASILLRVRYPTTPGALPLLHVEDAMITDADAPPLGPDKCLSTLGTLDEAALLAALHEQAEGVLPGPCVYEMAAWAVEHALEFVRTQWA